LKEANESSDPFSPSFPVFGLSSFVSDFEIRISNFARALASRLLAKRTASGNWEGHLSSSALSTAVASLALRQIDPASHAERIGRALDWLSAHRNADGGFGDTPDSPSNLSTTLLAWSALADRGGDEERSASWVRGRIRDTSPDAIAAAVLRDYGDDRTFSAPILTTCALAGLLGPEPAAWRFVPQLPFELAALPRGWFAALRLPVVSYALPALIAVGLVRHVRFMQGAIPSRIVRDAVKDRVLRVLASIQPSNGGFLEAAPLTGFVGLCLAAAGLATHPVARAAAVFLADTQREDGSWPIDTNLSVWVTTGSAKALAGLGAVAQDLWPQQDREQLGSWLLDRQFAREHPFTGAAPGGWGWTDRPGSVPDADDTSGALLALHCHQFRFVQQAASPPAGLPGRSESSPVHSPTTQGRRGLLAATAGIRWLLGIQNRDGGIPTFCRGWGRLPFDRSCPDLTAHALRAMAAWEPLVDRRLASAIRRGMDSMLRYLARAQNSDGSWTPLWFGNQALANGENKTYGTAQVLRALEGLDLAMARRGREWLIGARNPDGGWGGNAGSPSTVEETSLALAALAGSGAASVVEAGLAWLLKAWEKEPAPAPIGLYFARLWYSERLYPLIFTLDALGRLYFGRTFFHTSIERLRFSRGSPGTL